MFEGGLEFELKKENDELFDEEISCSIISGGKKIGRLGKIDRKILDKAGLEFEIFICELKI
jgi:phenylalanyl-tRNA synthetase beta subunit